MTPRAQITRPLLPRAISARLSCFAYYYTGLLLFCLCAPDAFAHRPYTREAGTFLRADGVPIFATEHYSDGIIVRDPVSVSFQLPEGEVLAQTKPTFDRVLVRQTSHGFILYSFPSDWVPVAASVRRFDGYELTDITTPRLRWLSPLIHTEENWGIYANALLLAGFGLVFFFGLRRTPRRGWALILTILGYVILAVLGLLVLLIVLAGGASPFIFLILGALIAALFFALRQLLHARSNSGKAA